MKNWYIHIEWVNELGATIWWEFGPMKQQDARALQELYPYSEVFSKGTVQ